MFIKALLAFLALPGVVVFIIPAVLLWFTGHIRITQPAGLACAALGVTALLWCVIDFYVSGKGTLAPWAPPRKPVTDGPYRYSRNPMYVAVPLILLGWASSFHSWAMLVYALLVVSAFHIRVVRGEEPWLAKTHGAVWEDYAQRVPRWFWR